MYNGSLPVINGDEGSVVRTPVFGSIANATILLFGLDVPASATYRKLLFTTMAEGPGNDPAMPVGNGEPGIGESAPVFWSIVKAEIPPAESFRLLTYRNLLRKSCAACMGVLPAGKGEPGTGVSTPLAKSNVSAARPTLPWIDQR